MSAARQKYPERHLRTKRSYKGTPYDGRREWLLRTSLPTFRPAPKAYINPETGEGTPRLLCVICHAVSAEQTKTFIRASFRGKQILVEWGTICANCRAYIIRQHRKGLARERAIARSKTLNVRPIFLTST